MNRFPVFDKTPYAAHLIEYIWRVNPDYTRYIDRRKRYEIAVKLCNQTEVLILKHACLAISYGGSVSMFAFKYLAERYQNGHKSTDET